MLELYYNSQTRIITDQHRNIVPDNYAKRFIATIKYECNMSMARLIRHDFDHDAVARDDKEMDG